MTNKPSKDTNTGNQVAWISMTDIYLLFSIFMIAVAVLGGSKYLESDIDNVLNELVEIGINTSDGLGSIPQQVKDLKEDIAKSETELMDYEALVDSLTKDKDALDKKVEEKEEGIKQKQKEIERLAGIISSGDTGIEELIRQHEVALNEFRDKLEIAIAENQTAKELLNEISGIISINWATSPSDILSHIKSLGNFDLDQIKALKLNNEKLLDKICNLESELIDIETEKHRLQSENVQLNVKLAAAIEDKREVMKIVLNQRRQHNQYEKEIDNLNNQIQLMGGANSGIRQELLGLGKKPIKNVVFVIDRSSTMNDPFKNMFDTTNRWDNTVAIISQWMSYLPIKNVGLVTFNSSSQKHFDGKLLPITQDPNDKNRLLLISKLNEKELEPAGGTDHILALQDAYDFKNIDAIILFTDGRPTDGTKGGKPYYLAESDIHAVIQFVEMKTKEGRNIPIHVVGVGDYFKPDMMLFFQGISKSTGGNFIGR